MARRDIYMSTLQLDHRDYFMIHLKRCLEEVGFNSDHEFVEIDVNGYNIVLGQRVNLDRANSAADTGEAVNDYLHRLTKQIKESTFVLRQLAEKQCTIDEQAEKIKSLERQLEGLIEHIDSGEEYLNGSN